MNRFIGIFSLFAALLVIASDAYAQSPILNSYPSASATVFLDFDGQYVTGTSWNWNGPIDAQPSGLSYEAIAEIFNRVAEDYRPFNLNITTDSTVYFAAPFDKRMRLMITPTYEWYGSAGGASYVGSFNWGNETPGWVFSTLLSNDPKYIAEACSHEVGHTLGLQHQSIYDANCKKLSEYNDGKGDGEIGWAPIMGMGYFRNLTTWNTGPNTEACNVIQNDLNVIASSISTFGFRADDHGDDPQTATSIVLHDLSFSVNGLINTMGDVDAFKLQLYVAARLKLNAIPLNVGLANAGADIDIKISIIGTRTNSITVYNPALSLNVGIDTSLGADDYYIMVTGTGNVNHSNYGSLGVYQLEGKLDVLLPVRQFNLKAGVDNGNHVLNWNFITDEKIKNIIVETSSEGKVFHQLVTLNANVKTFSYKPFNNNSYYRLKAITEKDEQVYYSSISKVEPLNNGKPVQLLSNMVQQHVICMARSAHSYELFEAGGRLLTKGTIVKGMNTIELGGAPKGIIFLRISDGVGSWTERLIKQ